MMLSKSQVKYIQSLGQKKCRDEEGVFIAEGPKLVDELLREKNITVKEIFALEAWIARQHHIRDGIQVTAVSEDELKKISQQVSPHAVLAVVEKIKWAGEPDFQNNITLALDTIQDPGNMGTIIRIADWFGMNNIFCNKNSADVYNPKVVQASMGSIARVRVAYVELEKWLQDHKGMRIYASVLDGRDITTMEKINEGIIIIGNESNGIQETVMKHANVRITIPKKARLNDSGRQGNAESLNAAVATGIILSHLL